VKLNVTRYDKRLIPILKAREGIVRKRDFTQVSVLTFRYLHRDLSGFTSEQAKIVYMAMVEASIVLKLYDRGLCPKRVVIEIIRSCKQLKAAEVYLYEYGNKKRGIKGLKHDIRALVLAICKRISKLARPYVHAFATSYDIIDTANAARLRDALLDAVIPALKNVEAHLCRLALEYATAVQVGRTHLQHASPVTFGFAISEYAERLGRQILKLERDANNLIGKFSGPVGTHAPAMLAVRDPLRFEKEVLSCMGLKPGRYSTQIVMPEDALEVYHRFVVIAGILANLADDMRKLQSTEVAEIGEPSGKEEGSSSVMPHKINPITWENMKSLFKEIIGRMIPRYLDLISDHQRDLTNSASGRFAFEMVELLYTMVKSANRILPSVVVDTDRMIFNMNITKDQIISDPLNALLARLGHPDSHATVGRLSKAARKKMTTIFELLAADDELKSLVALMTGKQLAVLKDPKKYVGMAPHKARVIARRWQRKFKLAV